MGILRRSLLVAMSTGAVLAGKVWAEPPKPSYLGKARTFRWEQGVRVTATGLTTGITARLPFPRDWPEQKVRIVRIDRSDRVRLVRFDDVGEGAQVMRVVIPRLAPGEEAEARVVFEVTRYPILPPGESVRRKLHRPRRTSRLRRYLEPSPYIDSHDARIRATARRVCQEARNDWERVRAIYDWVRDHVRYAFDPKIRPATEALAKGHGDCEELTSLFVAMCRAQKIPARSVWVPGHCYPEFYLETRPGEGRWYPCQAAGEEQFGEMAEDRPILQKGDKFRVAGERNWQRYVKEHLAAKHAASPPEVVFFRRPLPPPTPTDRPLPPRSPQPGP